MAETKEQLLGSSKDKSHEIWNYADFHTAGGGGEAAKNSYEVKI